MNVDEFEKIVESWRSYILVDALAGYSLEIDEDVPKGVRCNCALS